MGVTAIGFFEHDEEEHVLVVGIEWTDEEGAARSLLLQRSTHEPDEQDVRGGMDSYCVSTERGFTVYGCLRTVVFGGTTLTLVFRQEDAQALGVPSEVALELGTAEVDTAHLADRLREVLHWGRASLRPELAGLREQ